MSTCRPLGPHLGWGGALRRKFAAAGGEFAQAEFISAEHFKERGSHRPEVDGVGDIIEAYIMEQIEV